jgi:glycosyltransferase involved in cell wall biosynthesis
VVIPSRSASFDLPHLRGLMRAIRRHRIDLVQTHLLGAAVYGTAAARLSGVPVVCTFHGAWDLQEAGRYRAVKRWLVRHAPGRLVFVSESLRRTFEAEGFFRPGHDTVIHNGVSCPTEAAGRDAARRRLGVPAGRFLVGAIGNVRPAKGYRVLLEAAALLAVRLPDVGFVVAGDTGHPEYQALRDRRAALGLEDTVSFLGFREDIWDILGALDVLVSVSRSEGFSLTTVQAMAAGVPVVATRSGGPEEILEDGRTGLLVANGSAEAVAEGIERLYTDACLRARLGAEGKGEGRRRFSLRRMLLGYRSLYAALLGHTSQTSS